jgi:lipopolysaccharide export system protein LptC
MDWRRFVSLVVLAVLALLSGYLAQRAEPPPDRPVFVDSARPDWFMDDFVATEMDATGRPKHRLEGTRMRHFPRDDSTDLSVPYVVFYRDGEPPWTVAAQRGWVSSEGRVILLNDAVHIHRDAAPGVRAVDVETDELLLRPDEEYAETDAPIRVRTADSLTTGVGVRVYLQEERVEVLSQARGRYEPTTH